MKLSQSGIGTMRVNNLDEMYPAQDMLLQSGQLVQYGTGIYGYSNIVMLVKRNLERIIQEELNKAGCIEVQLPTLQPDTIWKKSGRWDKYIEEGVMLTVESDKGEFCLAPTAEEAVVEFAREKLKSYKHMPATYYQIGEKYRNEIRTRGYLLRGKSFLMMDAYSFDKDLEGLEISYKKVRDAYLEIAKRVGMKIIPVVADNGTMGGKKSEEFMLISPIGEDTILYDEETGTALNTEILERPDYAEYLKNEYGITDISKLRQTKSIEIGHIFQLGTRYSEAMNANFIDQDGKEKPYYMGCYGIGVSRTVATIYEENVVNGKHGEPMGISLPVSVAPYLLQIVEVDDKKEVAERIYNKLMEAGVPVIIDDRAQGMLGAKIKDCYMLGTPYMLVLGNKAQEGSFEIESTKTGEKKTFTEDELIDEFVKMNNARKYVK